MSEWENHATEADIETAVFGARLIEAATILMGMMVFIGLCWSLAVVLGKLL